MNRSKLRDLAGAGLIFIAGLILGGLIVWYANLHRYVKRVQPNQNLAGQAAEVLNNSYGYGIGSYVVYHAPGPEEMLFVVASMNSYPVVFLRKQSPDKIEVSIADKGQNILGGNLENEKFDLTSFTNVKKPGLKVTSIDMDADGTFDLVGRQSDGATETQFFLDGQWYPYKAQNGRWMIQTAEGWHEIEKSSAGFRLKGNSPPSETR